MIHFSEPPCPFECEFPDSFRSITHEPTYYGYGVTANDFTTGMDGEIRINYSRSHETAVDGYIEEYLDAICNGTTVPKPSPYAQPFVDVVFPFEQPVHMKGGYAFYYVVGETTGPGEFRYHQVDGRAFIGSARVDFRLSASIPVEVMKEDWRRVIQSFELTPPHRDFSGHKVVMVSGAVMDDEESPIEDATVTLFFDADAVSSDVTNDFGEFWCYHSDGGIAPQRKPTIKLVIAKEGFVTHTEVFSPVKDYYENHEIVLKRTVE